MMYSDIRQRRSTWKWQSSPIRNHILNGRNTSAIIRLYWVNW